MTDINLTELRAIAERTTPYVRYSVDDPNPHFIAGENPDADDADIVVSDVFDPTVTDHIAAFTPATVLALLDLAERGARPEENRTRASAISDSTTAAPEVLTGQIRGMAFEDGIDHGPECGNDDCECPDHEGPPRPAGTYITIRMDGDPRIGMWQVRIEREDDK